MNLLTEREFFNTADINAIELSDWVDAGIIRPIEILDNRFIFPKKQVEFASEVKHLIEQGFSLEEIGTHVHNDVIDTEAFSNTVQEENREQEQTEVFVEQTQIDFVNTEETTSYENLSYAELVEMANGVFPNFRRMTKDELVLAFTGTEEEVENLIETVRNRTRRRYGTGDTTPEQNEPLTTIETEPPSEPEIEVEESTDTEVEEESTTQEETEFFVLEEESTEEQEHDNPFNVPHSFEELQSMNIKVLATVVRDYVEGVKYFRRMTKDELLTCIYEPERHEEMMAIAYERYQRYRGRRYGQNRN